MPVAAGAVAAGIAWVLVHVAKSIADRPRPYEVVADAGMRGEPAHGTSFPSSHTAVTVAVAIALVPFLARPLAAVGIGYAVLVGWSRVYLGVHYPVDVLAGAGIGMATGGVILLALGTLLRRAGRAANLQTAPRARPLRIGPEPHCRRTAAEAAGTALAEGGDKDGLDALQAVFREHRPQGAASGGAAPAASSAPTLRAPAALCTAPRPATTESAPPAPQAPRRARQPHEAVGSYFPAGVFSRLCLAERRSRSPRNWSDDSAVEPESQGRDCQDCPEYCLLTSMAARKAGLGRRPFLIAPVTSANGWPGHRTGSRAGGPDGRSEQRGCSGSAPSAGAAAAGSSAGTAGRRHHSPAGVLMHSGWGSRSSSWQCPSRS